MIAGIHGARAQYVVDALLEPQYADGGVGPLTPLGSVSAKPQVNLANAMPEKFQEMRERWDLACVDEVPSGYKFTDLRAFKVRAYSFTTRVLQYMSLCVVRHEDALSRI